MKLNDKITTLNSFLYIPTIAKLKKEIIEQSPSKPSIPSVKFVALVTPTNNSTINTPYKNLISIDIPKKFMLLLLNKDK